MVCVVPATAVPDQVRAQDPVDAVLVPASRGKQLALIRKWLGLPEVGSAPQEAESLQEEPAGEAGEASAGQRHCGACQVGVLLVIHWPRPTIAQVKQMTMEQLRQYRLPFQ